MAPDEGDLPLIVCADQEALHVLRNSNHIVADGNFKYQPKEFAQFYTIHAFFEGECFPCIYALLPDKKATTYRRLWSIISQAILNRYTDIGPIGHAVFHFDYEEAAFSSVKEFFE